VYAKWVPLTSQIIPTSKELEFYDYSTTNGKLELDNTAGSERRVNGMVQQLLNEIVPGELQERLPGNLGLAQQASKVAHLVFGEFIQLQPSGAWKNGGLQSLLGLGAEF